MKKILIGILLILVALGIILNAVDVPLGFISSLAIGDAILCVALLFLMASLILDRAWFFVPVPLMLIFFFLEDNIAAWLGKSEPNLVSNWLVLGCTILIGIGLSMILGGHHKHTRKRDTVSLGDKSNYIDCATFKKSWQVLNFGNLDIYFENPDAYKGNGILHVNCRVGNMEIHVPNGWHIVTDIKTSLGNTEVPKVNFPDGPLLTIEGRNHLGNIEISYRV